MKHSLRFSKSKNNVPINIIQVENAEIVEFRLYFEAGFSYFSEEKHHVPHMLEHLLFGQDPELKEVRSLTHDMQRLGAVANASTDNDYITIMLTAPVATSCEALERILKSITNPDFSEAAIESERQIILRELYERYDGIGAVIGGQVIGSLLAPTAPTDRDEEAFSIGAIDEPTVRQAYADYIAGSNLKVVASGAVDAQVEKNVIRLISKYFSSANSAQKVKHPLNIITQPLIITNPSGDVNNASVIMAITQENLDPKERVARSVAVNMLFSTMDAVIPRTLRSLGYVYSIDVDSVGYGDKSIFLITLASSSDKLPSAIVEVYSLLKRYSEIPYPADEFESIKLYAEHIIPTINETAADLIAWYEPKFLKNDKRTSPTDELEIIKTLTAGNIADSVKKEFFSKIWHWGVISPDSEVWAERLHHQLTQNSHKKKSFGRYSELAKAEIARIPYLRTIGKREFWNNLIHLAFIIIFYPVLLTLAFAINLPNVVAGGSISFAHFAIETQNYLIGALALIPLCVIGMTGYSKKDFKKVNAALGLVAAIAYWYAIIHIFGSTGVPSDTFWELLANAIQPLFFGVVAPAYALTTILLANANRRLAMVEDN